MSKKKITQFTFTTAGNELDFIELSGGSNVDACEVQNLLDKTTGDLTTREQVDEYIDSLQTQEMYLQDEESDIDYQINELESKRDTIRDVAKAVEKRVNEANKYAAQLPAPCYACGQTLPVKGKNGCR